MRLLCLNLVGHETRRTFCINELTKDLDERGLLPEKTKRYSVQSRWADSEKIFAFKKNLDLDLKSAVTQWWLGGYTILNRLGDQISVTQRANRAI